MVAGLCKQQEHNETKVPISLQQLRVMLLHFYKAFFVVCQPQQLVQQKGEYLCVGEGSTVGMRVIGQQIMQDSLQLHAVDGLTSIALGEYICCACKCAQIVIEFLESEHQQFLLEVFPEFSFELANVEVDGIEVERLRVIVIVSDGLQYLVLAVLRCHDCAFPLLLTIGQQLQSYLLEQLLPLLPADPSGKLVPPLLQHH